MQSAERKCLHFYDYFLDGDLELIHVKLQSWLPFQIQIYVNGHEWLARQLDRHDIKYMKRDSAFVRLSDVERSQELADSFERVDWIHVLGRHALRVNPLLRQGDDDGGQAGNELTRVERGGWQGGGRPSPSSPSAPGTGPPPPGVAAASAAGPKTLLLPYIESSGGCKRHTASSCPPAMGRRHGST